MEKKLSDNSFLTREETEKFVRWLLSLGGNLNEAETQEIVDEVLDDPLDPPVERE